MLKFDIKRKINTLRDILVGKVPDPKAQVEQITIAMIYKFMDDIDLDGMEFGLSGAREFFKDDFEKYAWSNIMQSENSGQQRAILFAEGIDKMAMNPHLPQLFRDIFRGAYVPYRDPDTLNMFLKEISEFSYNNSEDLGNAFEYLLSIMGSQGDAGQFRTPRHIIDMIVEIVDPKKNETVLDPACGTAGFLISAYKHILENNKDENGKITLTADDRKRLSVNFAGYDISPDMVRLSRVNMYLHKFTKPQISEYDTLTSEEKWDDSFDVILANPPFMTPKGGIIPHNRYRVQAKRAEVLFVDYIAEHLNPTGRAGVIVPEGIVFQSANAYKALRKYLVDDNLLYAVISLPSGVFQPYSGVKTSVLLIDKTLAKQKDEILFAKLNNDGFDLGAQRREVKGSEINEIITIIQAFQNSENLIKNPLITLASKEKIAEQDYILVGERYKEVVAFNSDWPMVAIAEIIDEVRYTEKVLKSEFKTSGEYPIIDQSENFIAGFENDESKLFILKKPIICFGDHTRVLKYIDFNFVLGADGIKILQPKDGVFTKYLYYCLKNVEIQSLGYSRHFKILKEIKIPLPPLSVQEEIVAEIESYQKIIDGAKQIVDNYKPTIKFDPSWEMVKLGDICELQAGGTPLKSNEDFWCHDDYAWYTSGELNDIYTTNPDKYISEKALKQSSAKLFPKGSLLVGMYDTAAFKMSILDRDATFNQAVCGIKSSSKINMIYLLIYFTSQRDIYLNMRVGARQRNLTKQFICDLMIALPSIEIQDKIVAQINEEMAIVEQNKRLIEIFEQKIKDKINEVWGE